MVERYSISVSAQKLASHFSVDVPSHYKPRYNAGPTHLLPVITHEHPEGVSFFYWGAIPQFVKNKNISEKLINIRAESIQDKPALRKKMMRFRCVVPLDGFYSWKKISKKSAIPYLFFPKNKGLISVAAMWEEYEDDQEETHHTFSMITSKASAPVQSVNDRMPLLLDEKNNIKWLDKETNEGDLLDILNTSPSVSLESYTVSPRISALNVNEPSLLLPSAPADQHGNLTLFD